MKKNILLLLGGNKLNYGILKKFKDNDYLVYVVDWNKNPQLIGDKHYQIDVKDYKSIIDALKKDNALDKVALAYTSIDLAVLSVAMLNRTFGLKTISDNGLKYSSSKSMMTKRWGEKGILNRISKSYIDFSKEIINFSKERSIIIKPDNSASSRGITIISKNSSEDLIMAAFNKAKEEAMNKKVVVEEYVDGIEFTVDMLGDSYGNVSVYGISRKEHTENTYKNRIAVKLHYNSVSEELQNKIASFGIICYKALEFSSSLGHLEVILKNDGTITPIEIGARSSGYIASDLVDIVSGSNYLFDLIYVQKGGRVKNGLHNQVELSSVYFFYDFPEGMQIKNECNIIDFCDPSIISRYYDRANIVKGKEFNKIDNDNSRIGFEILEGKKSILTTKYIHTAEHKMLDFMFGR